ncbi:hypothetical protein J1605_003381 [Eschrichtius robustus]|uniref:Uncharacterized protein n=1 Tax=Eschrichtius robustus TaxID=9764 RepID=A0AB34HSE0_ESCRO|nr:hypothetical protein J1605_003381 [Eschrichtius robustus]
MSGLGSTFYEPGQGSRSARAAGAPGTARPRLAASVGSPRRGSFPRSQVPRLRTIRPSKCGAGEADGESDTQRLTSRPGGPRRPACAPSPASQAGERSAPPPSPRLRALPGDLRRAPPAAPGARPWDARESARQLRGDRSRVLSPRAGSGKSSTQGSEGTPGPQQARAEGSGSGLGAAGRAAGERQRDDTTGGAGAASLMAPSSPRLRVRARSRPVPGPRLNQVAPTVGSCAWGGWGQLLVLPGCTSHLPAGPQRSGEDSRALGNRQACARQAGAGAHESQSAVPPSRVSETNGRLGPRGSDSGDWRAGHERGAAFL